MKLFKKVSVVLSFLVILGLGAGLYFYTGLPLKQGPIYEYVPERDKADILKLFSTDRYWLLSNPDTDPAFLLDKKAPSRYEPFYFGKLKIKVLREGDTFLGFTAYYKKTFREGFLLFVAINPAFRGKHLAEKLVEHVLQDFKKQGLARVSLLTRTDNVRAQALYKRLGFFETSRNDGYVYFAKNLKP